MKDGTQDAILLIAVFLALRLVVSWFMPATIDESYAIVISRAWSLSYYDHPPLAFTLARLMAWMAGTENAFAIRLPFILAGTASAWLLYDITRLAYGERAAFWALAWFSVAPFFFISGNLFVVPDGPLDLFLLATLRVVLPDLLAPGHPLRTGRWLAAGLCFALALASKYQAVLFGLSALAFLLSSPPHRRLLRSPVLWTTLAVAFIGLVPTLVWNAGHDWVSFGFQAGRAGTGHGSLQPVNFLITVIGQMVYVLPGTWIVIAIMAVRGVMRPRAPADRLFAWFALVPPVIFLAIALVSRKSLPHWAMSGFLFGFPLAGQWVAGASDRYRRVNLTIWRIVSVAVPAIALAVGLHADTGMITRPFYAAAPRWDINWQIQDWSSLRDAWPDLGAPDAVVVRTWTVGAKAGHALGPAVTVVPIFDPRHFRYLETGNPQKAVAVQPAKPGEIDEARALLVNDLNAGGYRITGKPRILRQQNGNFLRFEIIAIPVERKN
ncbi:glycosyltransferase family 39 protein [Oricola nitratireducens]|uniref:glycosyltransferase family 39 protein n=1 Tax=Oricola nitratireducens TaxID=2775868 RepID=UPI0018688422